MCFKFAAMLILIGVIAPTKEDRIPLEEIWAYRMPGTQNIQKLDPRINQQERNTTVVAQIRRELTVRTELKEKAGPCFLVTGEKKIALKEMARIIAGRKTPPKSVVAGEPLSIAFYSYSAPGYVHIHSIEREASLIRVNYKVVTHASTEATVHFALIPIGKLPVGELKVEIVEGDAPTQYSNHKLTDRAVCDSNAFLIRKEKMP